jgi:hypothetical protein
VKGSLRSLAIIELWFLYIDWGYVDVTGNRTNPSRRRQFYIYGVKKSGSDGSNSHQFAGASISKGLVTKKLMQGRKLFVSNNTIKNINEFRENLGMIDNLRNFTRWFDDRRNSASVNNCGGDMTAVPGTQKIELREFACSYSSCTIIVRLPVRSWHFNKCHSVGI